MNQVLVKTSRGWRVLTVLRSRRRNVDSPSSRQYRGVANCKPESDRRALFQREHADISFGGRGQAAAPAREAIGLDIVLKILVGQDAR